MAAELLLVQSQLEKARQDLRHVEEGIKKTSVRDPTYGFGDRLGGRGGRRGGMVRPQMRERQFVREESPPKHKISSVASRLGPVNVLKEPVKKDEDDEEEDEEEETPTLKSTVIQSVGVTELTREAAVPVDKATVQRSRRLFGSLLMGTLNQFKKDKVKTKEQEDKQAVVLDKIQKKEVEQKVQSAAERKKLFQCKDGVKDEIKLLEEQMTVTEMKVLCEAERDKLVQFIQTKTSPPLFYLPKEHNKKTEAALKESTGRVTESYAARVAEFDSKLSTLKSRIEEVQQTKDAIVPTLITPLSKEKDPLQTKDKENGGQEKNKETGIKIEVQLRSKEENGHSKDDKKRRHSSASQRSEKEEKKDKKRRHSTESAASEKSAKEEKKDKKSKRRHSTTSEKSAKEEKVEVVTKSSSESESSSGESSAEEEKEKSPIKKSKKSPKKESKKSPRKESKSPRKRTRRSSKGKEE